MVVGYASEWITERLTHAVGECERENEGEFVDERELKSNNLVENYLQRHSE